MTTPTNWPNPERPGAPLFPENYGKHTLIDKETGNELNADWNNADEEWLLPNGWLSAQNAATHFAYVECVSVELTPTQIAEMLAGERERVEAEMGAYVKNIMDAHPEWNMEQLYSALKEREAIRNLGATP